MSIYIDIRVMSDKKKEPVRLKLEREFHKDSSN